MNRPSVLYEVRLPRNEDPIAAVTILDGNGSIIRIIPATEFRQAPQGPSPSRARRLRPHRRAS
jgi:hypothetical protein